MKVDFAVKAIFLTFFMSGCTTFKAPPFERPQVVLADRWIGASLANQPSESATLASELSWQDYFLDPRLRQLIAAALENNHDLRKAALQVSIAEKQYHISEILALPIPRSGVDASRSRARGNISEQYQANIALSNFELDFFGRVKNQSKTALNQYLQTREARDAAQISLINATAKLYFQWRVNSELRDVTKRMLNSRDKSYRLLKLRFEEGLSTSLELANAQSLLASANSTYQKQVRNTQQAENALTALLGVPIQSINLPKPLPLSSQFSQSQFYAESPSTLLLNRPDIRQAEYGLRAANAQIGAARAAMYPMIRLTSNLGYASASLNDLFSPASRIWSFAPSIDFSAIFARNQLRKNLEITELQQQLAIETYQSTIKTAFREVADALIAKQTLDKQYRADKTMARATAKTLRLVKLQTQEGIASGLNLLDAERATFSARQGVIATQLQQLINRVDLYTVMGGGLKSSNNLAL